MSKRDRVWTRTRLEKSTFAHHEIVYVAVAVFDWELACEIACPFRNVRFLEEGEKPTPDIRFLDRGNQSYCEVKTIGVSDDEIGRRKGEKAYSGTVYVSLSEGFLNKLKTDIEAAWKQIHSVGTSGLVFILVRFDDIALDYYDEYRAQLIEFGRRHGFKNVVIKVGHIGNRRITIPG